MHRIAFLVVLAGMTGCGEYRPPSTDIVIPLGNSTSSSGGDASSASTAADLGDASTSAATSSANATSTTEDSSSSGGGDENRLSAACQAYCAAHTECVDSVDAELCELECALTFVDTGGVMDCVDARLVWVQCATTLSCEDHEAIAGGAPPAGCADERAGLDATCNPECNITTITGGASGCTIALSCDRSVQCERGTCNCLQGKEATQSCTEESLCNWASNDPAAALMSIRDCCGW